MNLNNFTIKSQEAIQAAQQLAESLGNQSIEPAHLFKGMLQVDDGILPFIFKKVNSKPEKIFTSLETIINSLPKVEGGKLYLSDDCNKIFEKSIALAKTFGDDFVAIEHLLLALITSKDKTGQMLRAEGLNEKDIKDLPKSITSHLEIIPVEHIDEVLDIALTTKPWKT